MSWCVSSLERHQQADCQTTTSHLLFYQLQPTPTPAYDHPPTTTFPQGGGAGEGDRLLGWELRALGSAFIMGGCTSLHVQPHNLLITLRHPPSILSVPYPIPGHLLSAPGSHYPPPPLDGDGEDQVECDIWDMLKAKDWMDFRGRSSLIGDDEADEKIIHLYRRKYQSRRLLGFRRFSLYK